MRMFRANAMGPRDGSEELNLISLIKVLNLFIIFFRGLGGRGDVLGDRCEYHWPNSKETALALEDTYVYKRWPFGLLQYW